jgi:hypothetical protein
MTPFETLPRSAEVTGPRPREPTTDEVGVLRVRDGDDLVDRVAGDALERVRDAGLFCGVRSLFERGFRLIDLDVMRLRENWAAATGHDVVVWRQHMDERDVGLLPQMCVFALRVFAD